MPDSNHDGVKRQVDVPLWAEEIEGLWLPRRLAPGAESRDEAAHLPHWGVCRGGKGSLVGAGREWHCRPLAS